MGELRRLCANAFIIGKQHQTLAVEVFSGGRERKFAILALQQGEAQFAFQRLYLLGNGGLGDMAFFRGLGKAVVAHDGLKIANLSKHDRPPALVDGIILSPTGRDVHRERPAPGGGCETSKNFKRAEAISRFRRTRRHVRMVRGNFALPHFSEQKNEQDGFAKDENAVPQMQI